MARAIVTPLLKLIRNPKTGSTEWQFSLIDEPHAMSITECDSFSDDDDNKPSSVDQRVPGSDNKQVKITAGTPVGEWPLRLLTDSVLGRYVVASRDLAAGECVFEEDPFVQTIHDRCHNTACHVCYRSLTTEGSRVRPIGCGDCGQVLFCSSECAALGEQPHDGECGVLSALAESGNTAVLSGVRGLRLFIKLVHRAAEEPQIFAEEVESMAEHYSDADRERRLWLDTMAANINRFVPPARRMVPDRLAKLVSRVHTNLYGVVDQAGLQYGSGLYSRAGSLFNHSCAPTACVSFLGRTWRLHTLRPLRAGEEVSVSYSEVYASRSERQAAVQAKKGFKCACSRCKQPPPEDRPLDGWRCAAADCNGSARADEADLTNLTDLGVGVATGSSSLKRESGVVPPDANRCTRCGTAHVMPPAARRAREQPWREAIDKGMAWAHTPSTGGTTSAANEGSKAKASDAAATDATGEAAARRVLRSVERVLKESEGALCEGHTLRHRARKLRVYALSALPQRGEGELARALEALVASMAHHLPAAHPELAFFRYRLAEALEGMARSKEAEGAARGAAAKGVDAQLMRARAREVAAAAAGGLTIAYGRDHPTVIQWRSSVEHELRRHELDAAQPRPSMDD